MTTRTKLLAMCLTAATLVACSGGGGSSSADAEKDSTQSAPPTASHKANTAAPLPPGVFEMSRAQIMDPSGFEKPMLAATVLIPTGWRSEGAVVWGPQGQCGPDYSAKWQVVSPDGASALSMQPMPHWQGARSAYPSGPQQNQCSEGFYTSIREYLEASAKQLFPGARVLDYRPLDEEVKSLRDMMAQLPPLPSVQGFQSQITIDAGEILIAFEESGREMRGSVSAMATISRTRMADVMNPGRIGFESVNGTPGNFVVVKAPNGALDLGLRRRVLTSMRFDPEWSRRTADFNARKQAETARTNQAILQANADASAARLRSMQSAHESRMQSLHETSDIMNGIYQDRQLASDRQQRERIEVIRGVETYNDPVSGGPVQLDNTYQHAWRVNNRDNTYILTNDVNFNPGAYDIDAQQLKPLP